MDPSGKYVERGRLANAQLAQTKRTSDAANEELTWFFGPALSEIEGGSNYGSMIRAMNRFGRGRSGKSASDDGAEHRADALHAARIIYERLRSMPAAELAVLHTLYAPSNWPESLEQVFGWLTPLVCKLPWTVDWFETAQRRRATLACNVAAWLEGWLQVCGSVAITELFEQAKRIASRALEAYEAVRGEGASVVPDEEG